MQDFTAKAQSGWASPAAPATPMRWAASRSRGPSRWPSRRWKPPSPRITRREIIELAALYPAGLWLWWTQLEPLVRLLD